MIEVEELTKYYGPVAAIQAVSFRVERGEIVGFLGPNGAGKTTTMRILACFMPATSGRARVAGFDVFEQSLEVRRRIGYLPENVPLYGDMTVTDYLEFVAEVKGAGRSERRRRVGEVIERCLVEEVRDKLISRLSKGYRQRVGLAQALIADPEVLILDEPTLGLDPRQIVEIRSLIKSLGGQRTIILSTHILPEVSMVCRGVIIINHGRIVAQGTPETLMGELFPVSRTQVRVAGPAEAVAEALGRLAGVLRVEQKADADGVGTFVVESPRDRDLRAEVARLITQQRWGLLELRPIGMSLEDIFIRVVAGEAPATEEEVGEG